MLTIFIIAGFPVSANALTRTLNALIVASVEGLLREVVVLANPDDTEAIKIADHAGCVLARPSDFGSHINSAKGEWLMILECGALPEQGWTEAVTHHIQSGSKAARFTRSPLTPRPLIARMFQPEGRLALGLIIEKQTAMKLGQQALSSPDLLAKAAKPKPISAALRPA